MLQADLHDLTAHLACLNSPPEADTILNWQGWQISPVQGGRNGRVFRATHDQADLAVKFTARDQHDRAGREYQALQALAEAGLDIAARPLLLDRDRHPIPVVVMTWLDGMVADEPPTSEDAWRRLVEHLITVHTLTPATTAVQFQEATLSMRSPEDGIARIHQEIAVIPSADRPRALQVLMERFEAAAFPAWPPVPSALRRGDPNIRNFVQRPGPWASVDWEYSGWSDPAFEVAELTTHVAYLDVPAERWEWLCRLYAGTSPDPGVTERIPVYVALMYGWWVGRLGRMLYQVPRGLDERPAPWPEGWLEGVQGRYERYVERAFRALGDPMRDS